MRLAFVAGVSVLLVGLRCIDPASSSLSLLTTSCGAVTGLPCLFCGATRAMHHLLNGNVERAIYFNWLAIPILAVTIALMLLSIVEGATGLRILRHRFAFRLTASRCAAIACFIAGLWVLQITLAIRLNKQELLNPAGPLYALFVR